MKGANKAETFSDNGKYMWVEKRLEGCLKNEEPKKSPKQIVPTQVSHSHGRSLYESLSQMEKMRNIMTTIIKQFKYE